MKKRLVPSIATAFAVALYFAIVLPVQTYLACADSPSYTLRNLISEFLIYFLVILAIGTLVLLALSYVPLAKSIVDSKGRRRKKISLQFHVFALAVILAAIIESGPLSAGLPQLNGDFEGYRSGMRACIDFAVLAAVVLAPLLCYRWIKRHVVWFALAIVFFTSVSLLDVRKAKSIGDSEDKLIVHGLVPRYDVVKESAFSPSNNVIVLILDTISTHAMAEIFRKDPDLAGHFPGFVNYVDNLGMHWMTAVAVPGIMTGRHYESSAELPEYGLGPYSSKSFIKDYIDADVPVYLNLGISALGWSNTIDANTVSHSTARPSEVVIDSTLDLNICNLSCFRIVPYAFKEHFAMLHSTKAPSECTADFGNAIDLNINRDEVLWPLLSSKPVNDSYACTLHVHHSRGGHPPFIHNADGTNKILNDPQFSDYVEHCKFAVKKLSECFDAWRKNGVYDASTIVVTSDHGVWNVWPETSPLLHGIPSPAFPFIMVKPKGSKDCYSESNIPTTHAHIAKLVRALRERILDKEEISSVLYSKERFCRIISGGNIVDWHVTEDGNVKKIVNSDLDVDASKLNAVALDKTYSFNINDNNAVYPDFHVENGNRSYYLGLSMRNLAKPMKVSFRVPEKDRLYDLALQIWFHQRTQSNLSGRKIVCRCGGSVSAISDIINRDTDNYLIVKDCKPDSEGFLHVDLYYIGEIAEDIRLCVMNMKLGDSLNLAGDGLLSRKMESALKTLQSWRIDIRYETSVEGNATMSVEGENLRVDSPKWLLNEHGQGIRMSGFGKSADILLRNKGEGDIVFSLRGEYIANGEKKVPVYADYLSFAVNGKEMLQHPEDVWVATPCRINYHVADGEELNISLRLGAHKYELSELRSVLIDARRATNLTEDTVDWCLTLPEMEPYIK